MKKRKDGLYQKKITINGKAKHIYGKTQKEVTEKIINLKQQEAIGEKYKVVAEKWWKEHIETKVANGKMSPQTKKRYNGPYKMSIERFGEKLIKDITAEMIDGYVKYLVQKDLTKKTVKTYLSIINQVYGYAVVHGYAKNNPCTYVSAEGGESQTRELPEDAVIEKVKHSINCSFGFFPYFILYTGLRRAEALALTWDDIDFDNNRIDVNKTAYYIGNKGNIKTPKTAAGKRKVFLLENLKKELLKRQEQSNSEYIFPNIYGQLMSNSNYTRAWGKYIKETNLEKLTVHCLRHAYCTFLFDAGIDLKTAQELMGHSSAKMTQDIYTHISRHRQKEAFDKLQEFAKK